MCAFRSYCCRLHTLLLVLVMTALPFVVVLSLPNVAFAIESDSEWIGVEGEDWQYRLDVDGTFAFRPDPPDRTCYIYAGSDFFTGSTWFKDIKPFVRHIRFEEGCYFSNKKYGEPSIFTEMPNLQAVDFSNLTLAPFSTSVDGLFKGCQKLETVSFYGSDFSEARILNSMFEACISLHTVDLAGIDFPRAHHAERMFAGCISLRHIDFSDVSFADGTSYVGMFEGSGLESASFDGADFGTDFTSLFKGAQMIETLSFEGLSQLPVSIESMFEGCTELESIDLSSLDLSECTDIRRLFASCEKLVSIDLSSSGFKKLRFAQEAFSQCGSLTQVDLSNVGFDDWVNLTNLFAGCVSLTDIYVDETSGAATGIVEGIFSGCTSLTSAPLAALCLGPSDLACAFEGCTSLVALDLADCIGSFDADATRMFAGCTSLESVNMPQLQADDCFGMFGGCESLMWFTVGDGLGISDGDLELPDRKGPNGEPFYFRRHDPATSEAFVDEFYPADKVPGNHAGMYKACFALDYEQINVDKTPEVYCGLPIAKDVASTLYSIDTDYRVVFFSNVNAGLAELRVQGIGNYCGDEQYYFRINKATPTFDIPQNITGHVGQKLEAVRLPDRFEWDAPDSVLSNPGVVTHLALYVPEDRVNYEVVYDIEIPITVEKRMLGVPMGEKIPYDGEYHLGVAETENYEVVSEEHIAPGSYIAEVSLKDKKRCAWATTGSSDNIKIPWIIVTSEKFAPDFTLRLGANDEIELIGSKVPSISPESYDWDVSDSSIGSVGECYMLKTEMRDWYRPTVVFTADSPGMVVVTVRGFMISDVWVIEVLPDDRRDIASATVKGGASFSYTGTPIEPYYDIEIDGESLSCGTDYVVEYQDNVYPGIGTAVFSGVGSYKGSFAQEFEITPAPLASVSISSIPEHQWTGSQIKPVPVLTFGDLILIEGEDYILEYGENIREVGFITIRGLGNFTGVEEISFAIIKKIAFLDIDTAPHRDDIVWLANEGISTGWPVNDSFAYFKPYDTVKRCDMAAFLYRLAGEPAFEPSGRDWSRFSDINGSTPHAKEVLWLAAMGISTGFPDGTFKPYETVKRCDMAAFLHRMAGGGPSSHEGVSFIDVNERTPHYNHIAWLASEGVSTGFPDGSYQPYATVVRCDMAAFLHRMVGKVVI